VRGDGLRGSVRLLVRLDWGSMYGCSDGVAAMTVKSLRQELAEAADGLPVFYFDGSQSWDIEIALATHRTGDKLWIMRKPASSEQALLDACQSVVAFLHLLESKTAEDDHEIRQRVHLPLLEKVEGAIRQYRRANEAK
jgi:hypothetical protein